MTALRTIARYTVLEGLRNRLLWLVLLVAAAGIGLAGFLGELALTESRQLQLAVMAAVFRAAAVFLIATFVASSIVREANDKALELLLALPMPRASYFGGKLLGFCVLAVVPALVFGALALTLAPPSQVALWSLSLAGELWIVAAFTLFCALSLGQVLPALVVTGGFYLLARAIDSLQLLGHGQAGAGSTSERLLAAGMDVLAALLPHLEAFTRSEWLLYQSGSWALLAGLAMQTALYVALLSAAALVDLYRKNL